MLRTIARQLCNPRQDLFLAFFYWIVPFLLLVSSLPAFQPPSSWTCSSFPWNLKSGLNIFAPAGIPVGLPCYDSRGIETCAIARNHWLPTFIIDDRGLFWAFKIPWNNNIGEKLCIEFAGKNAREGWPVSLRGSLCIKMILMNCTYDLKSGAFQKRTCTALILIWDKKSCLTGVDL